MSSKQREALEKCDALLKRITKSAWFIEARMGLTKETMDVGNAITEALAEPLKNCEVGTAEEQIERFEDFCLKHIGCAEETGGRHCVGCPLEKASMKTTQKCELYWAQMPYEKEGEA